MAVLSDRDPEGHPNGVPPNGGFIRQGSIIVPGFGRMSARVVACVLPNTRLVVAVFD